MRVVGREALDSVFFLDETRGWIVGGRALFKTVDGGNTWQRVTIDMPPYAEIVDISFVNPLLGWVALQKRVPDALSHEENEFWLMQTGDGGQSWRLQHQDQDVVVAHISFANEQEGWLTGIRYVGLGPLRFNFVVLHTSDQGRHWMEVSGELNRIAANDDGIVNDGIASIIPKGSLTATLLTNRGVIFKTIDGGQNWQQIEVIHGELPQTHICCFGVNEGEHLWLAGGAYSIEGVWGVLAVEQGNKSWTRYRLGGVYFADALFLSEQQVLACGSISTDENDLSRRDGVVLYSSDGGRNWSIIYRNTQIRSINDLAVVNSTHVLAVGGGGSVIRLELPH